MAQYEISSTAFLPDGNTTTGTAIMTLSDKQFAMLRSAIQACGTIDVGELNLEEEMPVVYELLREACETATTPAVEAYYLRKFFYENRINYDTDSAMNACRNLGIPFPEAEYDYSWYNEENNDDTMVYYYKEKYSREYFEEWLPDYIDLLDDNELIDFMAQVLDTQMTDLGDWEFSIEVPDCFKD